jgi:phage minor structural protein
MISYFDKTETIFTNNGLGILDDYVINPVVSEELNGLFMFEFDYPIHAPHSEKLVSEIIVRAPVPELGDQLFRISERSETLGGLRHIVAYHVFYDLAKNLIEDTFITIKNGSGALNQLLNVTQYPHDFTGASNISTTNNARLVRLNPAEVLLDADLDNGFQARWGGEITRDNFHIIMSNKRGSDNGVQIRDKKNLTGYKSTIDYSSIVTRIMPEGYDGLFLLEKYVDSPRINHYVAPKIKVIKYDSVKVGTNEGDLTQAQAYAKLRELANQEYSKNHIDLPIATYGVEFAPLERTEEYKDFAALETVNIGDTVSVIHEEDGLNITARMMSYTYNPLLQAYISVSLGNIMPKFTDIAKDIKRVDTQVKQAVDDANYALTSANGKNTNYFGTVTPNHPRIGDIWYKENGDKIELWIYETREGVTQWYLLVSETTQEEIEFSIHEILDPAMAELQENLSVKDQLLEALEQARIIAEAEIAENEILLAQLDEEFEQTKAQLTADLAENQALQTQLAEDLPQAQSQMNAQITQVLSETETAKTNANNAVAKADSAIANASTALTQAQNAHAKSVKSSAVTYQASSSGTTAPTSTWGATIPVVNVGQYLWTRTVFTLQDNSTVTSYSVGMKGLTGETGATGAKGADGSAGTNAPTITTVQDQFYLSTSQTAQSGGSWGTAVPTWASGKYYWSRVATTFSNGTTTYSTPVLDVALNQSLVSSLEAKTTAATIQTTITQHATLIATKASQSSVDSLTGRMTTAETSITEHAGQIALKASQTSLNSLTTRVTTAESSITQQAGLIQLKASQSSVNSLNGKVTTAESKITQMATDINLRVTKADIINQINLSSEGILISANKLTIETAGNLFINSEFHSNNVLDGWSQRQGGLTRGFGISDSYYTDKAGSRSHYIAFNNLTDDVTTAGWRTLEQTFRARANSIWSMSAVVYFYSRGTIAAGDYKLKIEFLDSTGAILQENNGNVVTTTGTTVQKLENAIAPASTTQIRAMLVVKGQVRLYATRFMLNYGTKVAPYSSSAGALSVVGNMVVTGAITGDKITVDTGFFDKINAVSGNFTNINATKITTGTLSVDRLAANAIVAGKLATNSVITEKINAGAVTAAKMTIDAAFITKLNAVSATIQNLNASNITTGTLSVDRLAANSIVAGKLTISTLSSISANVGTLTSGTINASGVNVINLNAANITTGTLNAARIGANTITADKIKATSLDLFATDTYTNVTATGMRIQSKAQIIFANWNDSSGNTMSTQGLYIGGYGSGTKHIAFTPLKWHNFYVKS